MNEEEKKEVKKEDKKDQRVKIVCRIRRPDLDKAQRARFCKKKANQVLIKVRNINL